MEEPWEAPCGHMACHGCWMKVLPLGFACPVCKRRTQKRNLTKAYFTERLLESH
jgi:Prokaryotic RING finger family 4